MSSKRPSSSSSSSSAARYASSIQSSAASSREKGTGTGTAAAGASVQPDLNHASQQTILPSQPPSHSPNTFMDGINNRLLQDYHYWHLKRKAKSEYLRLDRSLPSSLPSLLSTLQYDQQLKSLLPPYILAQKLALDQSQVKPTPTVTPLPEPLDYVWKARVDWEKRLRFELRAVASKQNRPLLQLRGNAADKLATAAAMPSPTAAAIQVAPPTASDFQVRFVFTAEDLLEILCAIRNPNQQTGQTKSSTAGTNLAVNASIPVSIISSWNLIKLELPVLSMRELVDTYATLSPQHRQIGVDDTVLGLEWFVHERMKTGEEILNAFPNTIPASTASGTSTTGRSAASAPAFTPLSQAALRQYAKTGIPASLRPQFWSRMLGLSLPLSQSQMSYYYSLLSSVNTWKILTDDLIQFDISDGPGDDEAYFVFHEELDEILLAFSRDAQVKARSSLLINSAPILAKPSAALEKSIERLSADTLGGAHEASKSKQASDLSSRLLEAVPPNRVIPFHRLSYFATPLCFVYRSTAETYYVFRELFCKYFARLSMVSSAPSSILRLSHQFEHLLSMRAPHLVYKCVSLGVHPLHCSFGWMFSAFSGYLEVDQLLLLWDRLIAFDSFDLLAVLSAAIFLWRESSIMKAKSRSEIQEIMRELVNIKVIPLLQYFLFAKS